MALRKINNGDLIGKTIKSIDNSAVNVLELSFTDGSKLQLWAEAVMTISAGTVYGILVEEPTQPTF